MEASYNIVDDKVRRNAINALLDLELGKYEVVIQETRKTPPQRRYWHLCLSRLVQGTGYTLTELKTIIKRSVFGTVQFKTRKGEIMERDISSEELGVKEYSQLIDKTLDLAQLAGVPMPDPSMYGYEGILK